MPKGKILLIEDDEDIAELVRYNLAKEGYAVQHCASGEEGLKAARSRQPDLVILDLMLPGLDGLEVCRALREDPKTRPTPVIMLTARGEESDIVTGLQLGADDYIPKPFSPRVLLARIKAVLRRKSREATDEKSVIKIHDLVIHPGRHEATSGGKRMDLTFTEFHILHFLARRPGWVFTRAQIVQAVRGDGYPVTERSVDVQVVGLRKKLGAAAEVVETVRGVGYRFKE